MLNIRTLKKYFDIKRIEKDNLYYIDYTNYLIKDCFKSEIISFLTKNNINKSDYIIQELHQFNNYILRLRK